MSRVKIDSDFVKLFKSILKVNGFKCRGNKCTNINGELQLEISFRNKWGWPVPDVYIEVSDEEIGSLFQDDIRFTFRGYSNLRTDLSDEELLAMDGDTEARVRAIIVEEIVPQALALADRDKFLMQVNAGFFARSGVYINAVAKLRGVIS